MLTPQRAMPGVLGALSLALLAGTVQADSPAYWTAKNGWSTKPTCVKTGMTKDHRACFVMSRGKSTHNSSYVIASFEYNCNTGGEELLSVAFETDEAVDTDDPDLSVQWDSQLRETIGTWVRKLRVGGRRVYYYNLNVDAEFFQKLGEHRILTVDLPYRYERKRAKFALANVYSAIESALNGCGHIVSSLGRAAE